MKKHGFDWNNSFIDSCSDPLFTFERECQTAGFHFIAGIDEAGRGPLIGPVVVAGVIFPTTENFFPPVNDSKKISEPVREILRDRILAIPGIQFAIEEVSVEEIDRLNILWATMAGMWRVAQKLKESDYFLIDGNRVPKNLSKPARAIVKGDSRSASIAAASILAKTRRDDLLRKLDQQYPVYGLAKNKGYPTEEHLNAIKKYGITPEHRRSFGPVKEILSQTLIQSELDLC